MSIVHCAPHSWLLQAWAAIGAACGVVLGLLLQLASPVDPDVLVWVGLPGSLWIRALKACTGPLIAASMITGVAGMAASSSGKRAGGRVICLYLSTSALASLWGLVWLNVLLLVVTPAGGASEEEAHTVSMQCPGATGSAPLWVAPGSGAAGLTCNASRPAAPAASFVPNGTGAVEASAAFQPRSVSVTLLSVFEGLFPSNYAQVIQADALVGVISASLALGAAAVVASRRRAAVSSETWRDIVSPRPGSDAAPRAGSGTAKAATAAPASGPDGGEVLVGERDSGGPDGDDDATEAGPLPAPSDDPSLLVALAEELQECVVWLVERFIVVTPIAVASLLAGAIGGAERLAEVFADAALLVLFHFVAVSLYAALLLPALHWALTGAQPYSYLLRCFEAYGVALSCSSSAATLPVTMRVTSATGVVPPALGRFVCSLGATINLDGTAVGFPIVVLWLAAESGLPISASTQLVVSVISVMASVGAAPIPNAGIVFVVSIWAAAFGGAPLPPSFGVFLAVVWLLDREETACNVLGDTLAARAAAKWSGVDVSALSVAKVPDGAKPTESPAAAAAASGATSNPLAGAALAEPVTSPAPVIVARQ